MKKMKKVMALTLAVAMAVGAAVPAFAETGITAIRLKENRNDDDENGMIEIVDYSASEILDDDEKATGKFLVGPEADDYYFWFGSDGTELKNVRVSANGSLAAKVVKYDHDHMFCADQIYYVALAKDKADEPDRIVLEFTEGTGGKTHVKAVVPEEDAVEADVDYGFAKYGEDIDEDLKGTEGEYEFWEDVVAVLNKEAGTKKFRVVDIFGEHDDEYVLVKVTTEKNYGITYKEGTVKVTAENKLSSKDKKTVSAEITIISDVNIFDQDEVEWAADSGYNLDTHDAKAYSDYLSSERDYEYLEDEIATVITSRAFREIKGEDLGIETRDEYVGENGDNLDMSVEVFIEDVASTQKGVNFAFRGPREVDKNGNVYDEDKLTSKQKKDWETNALEFGFLGNQVIASNVEITFTFDKLTNLDLLEIFDADLDEEDNFVFHVFKDGKAIGDYKVNYADRTNRNEDVEFTIKLDAGSNLGMYRIQLDEDYNGEEAKEEPEEKKEENPNTGASDVIGVMAALAVVSAVAGAAVVCGKKHK